MTDNRQIDDWGEWIDWIKKHYDCSQRDIAERIDVSESYITHIKRGRRDPSAPIMVCLAGFAVEEGPRPPEFVLSGPMRIALGEEYL